MKRDYLYGTSYTLQQEPGMYHFNSDTELLGRFLIIRKDDTVLDIGCASGALMLYAAMHHPQKISGIDLFEEVTRCAKQNMEYNGIEAEVFTQRVQEFTGKQFSVILANPPYFDTKQKELISDNPFLAAARHEEYLTPDDLFSSVSRLLNDRGRFMMVHRASRIPEIFATALKYGFRCVRLKIAYQAQGKNAKSAAMEFIRSDHAQLLIEPPAYMNDRDTFSERGKTV